MGQLAAETGGGQQPQAAAGGRRRRLTRVMSLLCWVSDWMARMKMKKPLSKENSASIGLMEKRVLPSACFSRTSSSWSLSRVCDLFPLSLFPCPGTSMVRLDPPRSLPPMAAQCLLGAGCKRLEAHWGGRFVGEQRAGWRGPST